MRYIKHEPLKLRTEHRRYYNDDDTVREIDVLRKDIEELFDIKEIWRTTKWLTEQTEHGCARFDFTIYCMATKIAKRVLTGEELKELEEHNNKTKLFKKKEREMLSDSTYDAIRKYVFKCWKEYEKFNMLTFTKVKYTRSFGRRRSYTYRETAVKLTEKGKGVEV